MQEVVELIGLPDSVQQGTCGAKVGQPWSCRTWVYTDDGYTPYGKGGTFTLSFYQERGEWYVNHWE